MRLFLPFVLMSVFYNSIAIAQWQEQSINSKSDLRGLSVVSATVAWISGTQGTFGRTTDGGQTWFVGNVPDAEQLDFRDVEGFGEKIAYVLSIGPGEKSRIYKTADAGHTWVLQFKNSDPEAFYDAIAFWDEEHGIALSDPVKGQFQLVVTEDGGANWNRLAAKSLPSALPKESCFAASGTCLITYGANDVWFCTGGAPTSRVFRSSDRGRSWAVSETPILAGRDSAGSFSIAFRDRNLGVIVGGDYRQPNDVIATSATTSDAGKTWVLIKGPLPFRSGVAWAKDRWVAVGTSGSNFADEQVATWNSLDQKNYNAVAFASTGDGWAVGPGGRVAKFVR